MKIPKTLFAPSPEQLAKICKMEDDGTITHDGVRKIVKIIFDDKFKLFMEHYEKSIQQLGNPISAGV